MFGLHVANNVTALWNASLGNAPGWSEAGIGLPWETI
jgi:hypothetical protein